MAGEIFKKKREQLGLSIKEISELLTLNSDFLVSIENDLFEKLPVEVYTKGYIRCYAKYLGVDPEPIMQYYTEHLSRPTACTIFPIASSRKRTSKIFYLIPAAIIVMAVFFTYQQMSHQSTSYKPPKDPGVVTTVKKAEPVIDNSSVPADFSVVKETSQVVPEGKKHYLSFAAHENTWMYMEFEDRKAEEIFLRADESYKLEFHGKINLKIGNAGGIKLNLDGKDMGVLGEQAQVVDLTLPRE